METTQIDKRVWHNVNITGKWKLDYFVRNRMGPTAFGGYHLPKYPNPFNMETVYLKGVNGQAKEGYMMDKIQKMLYPDKNPDEKLLISWLICHPKIKVKGIKGLPQEILDKKETTQVTLTCIDYVEINEIEDDDFIDRINGRLSADGGQHAIGLTKLRYIMAHLGLSYMEPRFTGEAEKKYLRSKLKAFVRKSIENAKLTNNAIKNIEVSKDYFEFKEMIRLKVLVLVNGLYKFNGVPVGSTYDNVEAFFVNNPEVKLEATKQLYQLLN